MKHRKTHLNPLQKALMGKGFVQNLKPMSQRQCDTFKDTLKAGGSHEQASAAARRA